MALRSKAQPHVEEELVKYLEQAFRDRCPDPDMTDREIWMAVGEQRVIKHLRLLVKDSLERQMGASK